MSSLAGCKEMTLKEKNSLSAIMERRRRISESSSSLVAPSSQTKETKPKSTTNTKYTTNTKKIYKSPTLKGDEKDHFKKIMARRRRLSETKQQLEETAKMARLDIERKMKQKECSLDVDDSEERGINVAKIKAEIDERVRRNSLKFNSTTMVTKNKTNVELGNVAQHTLVSVAGIDTSECVTTVEINVTGELAPTSITPSELQPLPTSDIAALPPSLTTATSPMTIVTTTNTTAINTTVAATTSAVATTITNTAINNNKDKGNTMEKERGVFLIDDVATNIQNIVHDLDTVFQAVDDDREIDFTSLDRAVERASSQCNDLMEHKEDGVLPSIKDDPRVPFLRSLLATALHLSGHARASIIPERLEKKERPPPPKRSSLVALEGIQQNVESKNSEKGESRKLQKKKKMMMMMMMMTMMMMMSMNILLDKLFMIIIVLFQ